MSRGSPPADLLQKTAELVGIASVSHGEKAIADFVEGRLRSEAANLELARLGNNVCARTNLEKRSRLMLAGHLDTVPANGNEEPVIKGDWLAGIGSVDMKGGVAVFLELACLASDPAAIRDLVCDMSFVFYVCEEVDQRHSGLREVELEAPAWLEADAAVLGEPTGSLVEAGCQGVRRVVVETKGERAHTARPWMGANAIHRLAPVLAALESYEGRQPVLDGCRYKEALQAVAVSGGVAGNVVPDSARLVLNHRFAPDRTAAEAFSALRSLVSEAAGDPAWLGVSLESQSTPAPPRLSHPLLSALVEASGQAPKAKLGWTDVSFFSARGLPAANFGPGDPSLAHTAGERVERAQLERAYETLRGVVLPRPG